MAHPIALVSVLVAAALPAAANPTAVRVVSEVVACPSPSEVESALRQVLGAREHTTGAWTLWYGRDPATPAAEREASLLMELADPAGERLLSRRMPAPAVDCAAIGTAMAAVVERSLRDLGWTRGEPLPESAGASQPPESPGAKPVTETPATFTEATERQRVPRVVLGAGPLVGTSSRLGANLLVDVRARVVGPFCLRVGAATFAGSASESVPSGGEGSVRLSSRTFMVSPLAALVVAPVELAVGPVVWLAADQASSSKLPRVASGRRLVMAVGAGIALALPLSKRWRIGLALEGGRVAFAPDTYLESSGTKRTVLAPPPWQGMAAAKLEFVPWP
jgi:hypothetical protein